MTGRVLVFLSDLDGGFVMLVAEIARKRLSIWPSARRWNPLFLRANIPRVIPQQVLRV